ncbi:hypothetical protein Salat_2779000 [Sesamum alatum]|uniref:Uncharacterized protein n=1 Tax=Sesamum alatum TaxID=300844 RepID=A0AAE1XKP0_9LAMI|nr:hypothetical protein Salat_2779000 [Sesamum alatum]
MDETPGNPVWKKDKQVTARPSGVHPANLSVVPEIISISPNDLKNGRWREEWSFNLLPLRLTMRRWWSVRIHGVVCSRTSSHRPKLRRELFPPKEELAPPPPRHRGREREHRAPSEGINSRAVSQQEKKHRRIDEVRELSYKVDHFSRRIEDLR